MVHELTTVIKIQARHLIRDALHRGLQRLDHMDAGIVTNRFGKHPPALHIGQIQGSGEFASQCWTAMGDSVTLEEPGDVFDFVTGFANVNERSAAVLRVSSLICLAAGHVP